MLEVGETPTLCRNGNDSPKGKEQPELRIYFEPRAMRKTIGLTHKAKPKSDTARKDSRAGATVVTFLT
jgi:hypothetical protein